MTGTLEYNTERGKLLISEYGRIIQKMIKVAVEEPNKEKRQLIANEIIKLMGQLNPHLRDVADYKHKLWDHLFVMSDFKLDVDSPYPIPTPETIKAKPDPMGYSLNDEEVMAHLENMSGGKIAISESDDLQFKNMQQRKVNAIGEDKYSNGNGNGHRNNQNRNKFNKNRNFKNFKKRP